MPFSAFFKRGASRLGVRRRCPATCLGHTILRLRCRTPTAPREAHTRLRRRTMAPAHTGSRTIAGQGLTPTRQSTIRTARQDPMRRRPRCLRLSKMPSLFNKHRRYSKRRAGVPAASSAEMLPSGGKPASFEIYRPHL